MFKSVQNPDESLFLLGNRVLRVQKQGNDMKLSWLFDLTEIKSNTP